MTRNKPRAILDMPFSRRRFLGTTAGIALAAGAAPLLAACGSGSSENEVAVLSWGGDYLDPELGRILKEEAGLTLRAVPSESDQDMFTKLKAGGGDAYDIVFANCGWSPTYYKAGLIEAFDISEVANGMDIWPLFREDTSLPHVIKPNTVTLFPNMWDSISMIWNTATGYQPGEPYSWSSLWDPALPPNTVEMKGAPEDFIAMTGLSLGVPRDQIYAMEGAQLDAAARRLTELKPFQIANSDAIFDKNLVDKSAWIGMSPSLAAESRINDANGSPIVKAVTPVEGTLGWIDGPQLVKGAKHRENALKFMEVWNGEQWQTWLFNKLGYAQCNRVATERVLAAGGAAAQNVRNHGGDNPDQAKNLLFQGPPNDPAAWAKAYDAVVASR